jgi:hypothetical protein
VIEAPAMSWPEYYGKQTRHAEGLTWKDSRELSARFGFLLAIPAVSAT